MIGEAHLPPETDIRLFYGVFVSRRPCLPSYNMEANEKTSGESHSHPYNQTDHAI